MVLKLAPAVAAQRGRRCCLALPLPRWPPTSPRHNQRRLCWKREIQTRRSRLLVLLESGLLSLPAWQDGMLELVGDRLYK